VKTLARAALLLTLWSAASAHAQVIADSESDFGAHAVVRPPDHADVDPTATGTTVSLEDRSRAVETLDEVLLEVPGARARRSAGFGGFTSLSLRGADAEHTTVLLGDLPVLAPDGSAFDLSTLPTWMFSRVEVYRGGAPMWLGVSPIGGVLRLVPHQAGGRPRYEVALGGGSFDLGRVRASLEVGDRQLSLAGGIGLTYSGGRFPYRDDGGTAFDPTDDSERLRQNGHLLEGAGALQLRARLLDGELGVVIAGLSRTGGLQPPPSRFVDDPTGRRRLSRIAAVASMQWLEGGRSVTQREDAAWHVQAAVGLGLEERALRDPLAQFGLLPRIAVDALMRVQARAGVSFQLAPHTWIQALLQGTHESITSEDLASGRGGASQRQTLGLGLEGSTLQRFTDDLSLDARLSGRIEGSFAHLVDVTGDRFTGTRDPSMALPSGRLGLAMHLGEHVSIMASASASVRAPSMIELFGDRGFLAGNPALDAETSWSGDAGSVVHWRERDVVLRAELRGFASRIDNLIRYVRVSANQVVPLNIAAGVLYGAELGVSLDLFDALALRGAVTALDARDATTNLALPLRPAWTGYARLEAREERVLFLDRLSGFVDLEGVSATTADPAALIEIPSRVRVGLGLGARILGERLQLDVRLTDLFDARGYDSLGLPLPGRAVFVELTVVAD
jgi:vitamin B12 transporter